MTKIIIEVRNGCSAAINAENGRLVRFSAKQVPGKGWTVVRVEGSKKQGHEEFSATEFDDYTMHQAQATAEAMYRDMMRSGEF